MRSYNRRNYQNRDSSLGAVKIFAVVAIALLVSLSVVQIFLSARVAVTGTKIRQLEEEKQELTLKTQRLQTEIDRVSSLTYLEGKARSDLGMVDIADQVQYLSVPGDRYLAAR